INLGPCSTSDPAFSGQSPDPVSAINLDDDLITVSPATGLVSQPAGGSVLTFTFNAPVTGTQELFLQLRSSNAGLGWASPTLMRVSATNATPPAQTTTLFGSHQLQAACTPYTIEPYAVMTSDTLYRGFELPVLPACNQGNRAPIASDVAFATDQGASVTLPAPGLWNQAFDPDGDPLTLSLATVPAHGSATLNADGSVVYVPAGGFSGVDSFTYTASDSLDSATATIQVTVGVPAPQAAADSYALDGAAPFTVAAPGVLANDTPTGGNLIHAQLVQPPAHGTLSLSADGSFSYTADQGYGGLDSFSYSASDGTRTSAPAQVVLTVMQGGQAATLSLSSAGGSTPGSMLTLHAAVTNLGTVPLQGARLLPSPAGLVLLGASGPSGALTTDGSPVVVPDLAVGESVQIHFAGQLSAPPGERAGATLALQGASGIQLGPPQSSFIQVARLRFDAGGCGCASANPGAALAWMGALVALARRRRRSPLPGRGDLHLGDRLIARDDRRVRFTAAERVHGDDRDLLPPLMQHDVGAERSGRRDVDGLPLHVHAASGGHAARDGNGAPVRLVAGPLHREKDAAKRSGGSDDLARLLHVADLPLADVHRLAAARDLHRAAGGSDRYGAAFGGEEEVTARALRHRPVLDLQRDAALPLLDAGLDAAAHPAAQDAGRSRAQADLAAVVQLHAHAVDGKLRLGVGGSPHGVALAEVCARCRRLPCLAATLQLDRAARADQHRRAFGGGRRRSGFGAWSRRGWDPLAPARLRACGESDEECRTGAHPIPYMGNGGYEAITRRWAR
ncbi:MAG TPA: cadherin-like domain-containing protein, partial [Myxococcales bacterium]|nr:cadherin-like domain-containing protein [Myxococcales bacterium]